MNEPRTGKALINATKEFAVDDRRRSAFHLITTFLALITAIVVAVIPGPWWLRLPAGILGGLVMVRTFIIYHDHQHHAIFRGHKPVDLLMKAFGLYCLSPSTVWKQTHNHHHTHNARLHGSHIGSFEVMTTRAWSRASFLRKLGYYASRHPVTIALGYPTVFFGGFLISPLLRSFRRHWDSALALVLHVIMYVVAWQIGGVWSAIFAVTIPFTVASASGAYLFYVQHNFPGVKYLARDEWTYAEAATESSSLLDGGPITHWFTGNIGYHHVHHLNPLIPFYRLPEAMAGIPELQDPETTSLKPWDIYAALRLNLWDPEEDRMVTYGYARKKLKAAKREAEAKARNLAANAVPKPAAPILEPKRSGRPAEVATNEGR